MALIYEATLTPGKLDLLNAWVPGRAWATGTATVAKVATFRLDDPAGEVGVETFLLRADSGALLQVPLTYRAEPLDGAQEHLVGTMEHSVLGTRWVYDACGDPVWAAATAVAILTGGTEVPLFTEVDGVLQESRSPASAIGSGTPGTPVGPLEPVSSHDADGTTVVRAGDYELAVARVLGVELPGDLNLTSTWDGGSARVVGLRTLT